MSPRGGYIVGPKSRLFLRFVFADAIRLARMSSSPDMAPDPSPHRVYSSAVDLWLLVLLMAGPLVCVGMTIYLMQLGRNQESLQCLWIGAGLLLVTGICTVPCRYTLTDQELRIRCGVYSARVSLDQIRDVARSGSWLSGPALSLRRVKISTPSRFYLVSPVDRDQFIAALRERCPQLPAAEAN